MSAHHLLVSPWNISHEARPISAAKRLHSPILAIPRGGDVVHKLILNQLSYSMCSTGIDETDLDILPEET